MKARHYVLLVTAAVLCLAVIAFGRWMRPYDLETERAAARAAGIPMTVAEFPQRTCPPGENAISDYAALEKALKAKPLDTKAIGGPVGTRSTTPSAPPTTPALEALIRGRPDVARLVHAAASKPHACVKHVWTANELFPYLAQMREATRWLRWESLLMARRGQYADAVRNQALALRIARQAGEDPTIISHLVSIACERLTMQGFSDILSEAGPNVPLAEAVQREIAGYRSGRDLQRCLKGEMLFGINAMGTINSIGGVRALTSPEPVAVVPKAPNGKRNFFRWFYLEPSEAVYIHWMAKTVKAAGLPEPQRVAAMAQVQKEFDAAPKKQPSYIFAKMLMPVFSKVGERDLSADAQRGLVSAMASVMTYRGRTGRWPAMLDEAAQPVPTDPYTRKPLGYRREGLGFVLFAKPDVSGQDERSRKRLAEQNTLRYPPASGEQSAGRP